LKKRTKAPNTRRTPTTDPVTALIVPVDDFPDSARNVEN
jgi:hypothetical protein